MARLLKKITPWGWSRECSAAFDLLKQQITSNPVLRLPDPNLPFILTTDWSRLAIGAALSQKDPETGFDHPIAYKSRLLSWAERNYASTEAECIAVIWAIQKFRVYLDGCTWTVGTLLFTLTIILSSG
jgi:RNase H-like domain found in reverse transcriptase